MGRHGLRPTRDDERLERWTWRFDPALLAKLAPVDVWTDLNKIRCPVVFIRGRLRDLRQGGLGGDQDGERGGDKKGQTTGGTHGELQKGHAPPLPDRVSAECPIPSPWPDG